MKRFVLLYLTTALMGCGGGKSAPPAPPPPAVTVIQPVMIPVQKYYEYNGTIEAENRIEVRARVEGFLQKVLFKEGDIVEVGQLLYEIDPSEYDSAVKRASGDIKRAVADIDNAEVQVPIFKKELDRLIEAGSSPSDIAKAKAVWAEWQAKLEIAQANKTSGEAAKKTAELKQSYTKISSPIRGRIGNTRVNAGNVVGQNELTLLTTIVSLNPMDVKFDVPEKDVFAYEQLVKAGSATEMLFEIGLETDTGFPHPGTLDFQNNSVNKGTGTITIRGKVENLKPTPWGVRPLQDGNYCRVRVPIGKKQDRLAIPEDALMTGQEGRYVFVIGKENKIEKRTVVVGQQVWRRSDPGPPWTLTNPDPEKDKTQPPSVPVHTVVSIDSGLHPGDRIVAVGLLRARPGQPVNPDDWQFRAPAGAK